jgi:peptidoglycan/LPS O-acetylase OafA/YrhL
LSDGAGTFVLLSALFMANITPLFGVPMVYGPLWSLAVEEHFYMVWPTVVRRLGKKVLLGVSLSICVAEPLCRGIGHLLGADVYYASWFRFDGLAWGATVALFFDLFRPSRLQVWAAALSVVAIGVGLGITCLPFGITTRHTLCGAALQITPAQLIFVGLVAAGAVSNGTWLGRILSLRVLTYCGKWSYCIYIIHFLVMKLFDRAAAMVGLPPDTMTWSFNAILLRAVTVVTASVLIAALSYRFFEEPLLRLKKHFV